MKEIESKLLSIKQLFTKDKDNRHSQFIVPEYQRGYSWWWSDKCDALWQDIVACVKLPVMTRSHFLGSIIIDKSDNETLKLVDGQQRLTTFILLLKALLIR